MRDINRYQADYVAAYGFERYMVRYRRRQVLECLARLPHERILEVGCGMEPLFEHLETWRAYTIVEPAPKFAEHARGLVPPGKNVTVHESLLEDATALLGTDRFDFIVASSLLHEVPDPALLLSALRSLCGAGTVVHINVPNAASLHNRLAVSMGLIPNLFARSPLAERMQRRGTYDLERLVTLVQQEGFAIESSGSYFLKPFTHGQLQQMLERGIIDERVLDALYEVNGEFAGCGAEVYVNVQKR